jgi:hypothetical protein
MKIAQVGNSFNTIRSIDYFSSQTFLEYDVIIIDLDTIVNKSSYFSAEFFKKRRVNLEEFLKIKKTPIVYLSPSQEFFYVTNIKVKFGTLMPVPVFSLIEETGIQIGINTKTHFCQFLKKYQEYFYYTHYYENFGGTAIAETPYTHKTLGFCTENSIFLPKIKSRIPETEERQFIKEMIDVLKSLPYIPNSTPLPEWTKSYSFPDEVEINQNIKNLELEISQLNIELYKTKDRLETIIQNKKLLTSFGEELEIKVETIFKELGFEIIEAERNRDDLIVKHKDLVAVVEIKGLTNSAGEKNAAQLEKWRATYYEKHEVNPKGILLVNAYRETPLLLRDQPAFPHQMLAYAKGREHCLMTTTQLLTIYFEAIKNPASKDAIIKSIFDTVGLFNTTYKWRDYIKVDDDKK